MQTIHYHVHFSTAGSSTVSHLFVAVHHNKAYCTAVIFCAQCQCHAEIADFSYLAFHVLRSLGVHQLGRAVEIHIIDADVLSNQTASLISFDSILEETRPVVVSREISQVKVERVPLATHQIKCLFRLINNLCITCADQTESHAAACRCKHIDMEFLHRGYRCLCHLRTNHTLAIQIIMQIMVLTDSLFGHVRFVPPALVVAFQRSGRKSIGVAVDALHLCSRPCRNRSRCSRNGHTRIGGNGDRLAILRFVLSGIQSGDDEVILCSGCQTCDSNLAFGSSQFQVNTLGSIHYVVFGHLVIVRCINSYDGAVPCLAYRGGVSHHRLLGVVGCHVFAAEDLELKDLHTILRSSFGAPETDVTYFVIVIQLSAQHVRTTVDTGSADMVVTQYPIGIVLREIYVIILRARTFKMNSNKVNAVVSTQIHYEPSVESTGFISICSTVGGTSLIDRTIIAIYGKESVCSVRSKVRLCDDLIVRFDIRTQR